MKATKGNTAPYFFTAWKLLGLSMLFFLVAQASYAQNTKGAEVSGGGKQNRESRFRTPAKKNKKGKTKRSFNRLQERGVSLANSARKSMVSPKSKNVFPQHGRFVNKSSKGNNQKAWNGTASGSRLKVRSNTGKTRNVYPQYGRYVNNPSRKPKNTEHKVTSNQSTVSRLNRLQRSHTKSASGGRKQVVIPRSASHSFMARKSINVYANFARPKPKKEKAHTKDITGRTLRTKNFETPRPQILAPTFKPYGRRKRVGDNAYRGRAAGSHQSASRSSERAWKGNISGNKIRGRNFTSKPRVEGTPSLATKKRKFRKGDHAYRGTVPGSGYRSATRPGETRPGKSPLPVRSPGIGANRIGKFQGSIKGTRIQKGGGSRSGRSWNNRQSALPVRTPGQGASRAGTYQGNIKRFGKSEPGYSNQGEGFTGYKKARKPVRGGGTISGRTWNNKQAALPVRIPKPSAARAGTFQGNIKRFSKSEPGYNDQGEGFTGYKKARKPVHGGGTISGRVWNNKQSALPVRTPKPGAARAATYQGSIKRFSKAEPGYNDQGEGFTGYKKAKKPVKGGGSISGRLWNNKEKPIVGKTPPASAQKEGAYAGDIKLRKFKKNYIQNPNAADESLKKKHPDKTTYAVAGLQVKVKERDYVKNKNAADEATLKKKPTKSTYAVGGLQVRVKEKSYGKKPHAVDGSMPGIKPTKSSVKASEYARGVRRNWQYIHNPSSADEALKVREPGKAFGRSTDYQGNIKMQKFVLFEKNRRLHPDATFVKTNKNNVDGERDILTNVKLWWSRHFKKQETQPENLKDKGRRPRYDKREQDLWND